jgi:small nuclear ribonucleoprotein (snRNP)-like protein
MNVALEQAEEIENEKVINRYANLFIRGNNGNYF